MRSVWPISRLLPPGGAAAIDADYVAWGQPAGLDRVGPLRHRRDGRDAVGVGAGIRGGQHNRLDDAVVRDAAATHCFRSTHLRLRGQHVVVRGVAQIASGPPSP